MSASNYTCGTSNYYNSTSPQNLYPFWPWTFPHVTGTHNFGAPSASELEHLYWLGNEQRLSAGNPNDSNNCQTTNFEGNFSNTQNNHGYGKPGTFENVEKLQTNSTGNKNITDATKSNNNCSSQSNHLDRTNFKNNLNNNCSNCINGNINSINSNNNQKCQAESPTLQATAHNCVASNSPRRNDSNSNEEMDVSTSKNDSFQRNFNDSVDRQRLICKQNATDMEIELSARLNEQQQDNFVIRNDEINKLHDSNSISNHHNSSLSTRTPSFSNITDIKQPSCHNTNISTSAGNPEHTQTRPFICDHCGRQFTTSAYLVQHQRIHAGIKPYRCRYCDRRFIQLSHVQQHERIHTGEKPYKCWTCQRSFTQMSNLQSHQRQHMKGKPFRCSNCFMAYDFKDELEVHVQAKHTGVRYAKGLVCVICNRSYNSETYLTKHLQKHKETSLTLCNETDMQLHPSYIPPSDFLPTSSTNEQNSTQNSYSSKRMSNLTITQSNSTADCNNNTINPPPAHQNLLTDTQHAKLDSQLADITREHHQQQHSQNIGHALSRKSHHNSRHPSPITSAIQISQTNSYCSTPQPQHSLVGGNNNNSLTPCPDHNNVNSNAVSVANDVIVGRTDEGMSQNLNSNYKCFSNNRNYHFARFPNFKL